MHVLILNQTFHPDVAATAQLMWDLGRHLSNQGHRVSAVASRQLYGTDRRIDVASETIDGVEIHRLSGTALGKRSTATRLLDFASFYAAAAAHLNEAPAPDVILALTSPPLVATLAMLARQFQRTPAGKRVKFVYHVMDLYPDAAVESGVIRRGSGMERTLRRITSRTLDAADAVIALGRDMKDRLLSEYPRHARAQRIHVVPPWADGAALWPLCKNENPLAASLGVADSFNIVYSGNLGVAHDLDTLTRAIDLMRDDVATRWLFIGGGKRFEQLRRQAEDKRWPHVRLMPYQDREGLNASLNLADVHLVSQLPAFTGVVVPSKLFGILAVGKPSIMIGPAEAECSRIIEENRAGFVVSNGDAESLVSRLRQLRDDVQMRTVMGAAARRAFERKYDRPIACERITQILERAARQ